MLRAQLFGFIFILHILVSPTASARERFRVMFYNVENLFDTEDNPLKNDDDFLPDGFYRWTPWKYWGKMRNITRVITAVGEMRSPALVGLCEVENDSVLFDLTRKSPLREQGYEYIITDSPDERGINVALLYQRHQFKLIDTKEYEVAFSHPRFGATRNILHVVGELINRDTLDVLVCHFPSRSSGQRVTEPARLETAALLRRKADSILAVRERPYCLMMGDFNDPPESKSLLHTIRAGRNEAPYLNNQLYNLFFDHSQNSESGTYKYQGKWEVIDQFIVNGALLRKESGIYIDGFEAHIFNADFLLEKDEKYYGHKPFRTNLGPRYHGGFSDHLPIYLDLIPRM